MTPLPACEDFPLPRRIAESAFAACVPIAATFEITRRCNLRCRHCFNTDRRIGGPGDPAEIPTEIAIRILEGLREAGGLHVAFTGGEPLIHPDLATLVGIARSLGFIPALLTNGTRLDRGAADALAEAGLEEIRISLHGASAAGHDRFTGEPGSFDAALRGIAAARAAGISVRLALLLTGASAGEAAGMLALAAGMNLPFRIDLAITPRHDGTRPPEDIPADRGTRAALFRGPLRHFLPTPDPTRPLRCACARSTCGIDATGELLPCLGAPIPAGNLRERPFADLWRNSPVLNRIRALTDTDFTACGACPLRAFCRRSPGAAYLATGNYTGPDPQACVEAGVLREILSPGKSPTPASRP
ncbi:MAG: radical SAM protein [Planctomycetota bacterium]